jgi:predicted component of type VI protein secretion system
MIEDVVKQCDFNLNGNSTYTRAMTLGEVKDVRSIARKITNAGKWSSVKHSEINKYIQLSIPVLRYYRHRWCRKKFCYR